MLKRAKNKIPSFIKDALTSNNLYEEYMARPAYQQNDYIGWIVQAKQEKTQNRRLQQMLSELKRCGIYMKMKHPPSAK